MWTATWTLGERRLSIQCQPKRGRQGTEREMKKRCKKKQRAEILANRHPTGSTPAVPWLYPTQSSWKRFATDSDRLACLLSLSLSLSVYPFLRTSCYIALSVYLSLCPPLSFSTSLCLSAPLSATEIWDLWIRRKIKKFHIALEHKKKDELINLDLNVEVNNAPERKGQLIGELRIYSISSIGNIHSCVLIECIIRVCRWC